MTTITGKYINKAVTVAIAVAVMFALGSCKKEEAAPSTEPVRAPVKKVEVVKVEEAAPVAKVPAEVFVEGIRNPFRNPYMIVKPPIGGGTPLENVDIGSLVVKAVIVGDTAKDSMAMISTPDKKSYVVRVGTPVGLRGGKAYKIDNAGVHVREQDEFTGNDVDILIKNPQAK